MTALDATTPQQPTWDRPKPILWLHVLSQRRRLDRMLAGDHSPTMDARLMLRARQLVQASARARLAAALHDAVRSVEEPQFVRLPQPEVPVAAASVRACAAELGDLARALMDPHPRARGVVLARELLTDTTGPLYTGTAADQLRSRILTARSAL